MRKRYRAILGIASISILPILGIFIYCHNVNIASATMVPPTTVTSELGASITSSATITIDDVSALVMRPSADGDYKYTSFNVEANSNDIGGYSLVMYADDSNLTGVRTGESIPSVETSVYGSEIPVNHWGLCAPINYSSCYGEGYDEYSPINTSSRFPSVLLSDIYGEESVTLSVGAKLDLETAADIYTTTLNFALVANYTGPSIYNLIYLQDFADLPSSAIESIFNDMNSYENYTLIDKRDNKQYTIAKLSDDYSPGKIWMTSNLDLAGGTTLSSEDTDIPAGYVLPTSSGFGANNTLPSSSTSFSANSDTAFVYNSNNDDCSDGPCYSYYSWTAATAGSGNSITYDGEDADYSICPAGWRLPKSGNQYYDDEYGYEDGPNPDAYLDGDTDGPFINWKKGDFYRIAYYWDGSFSYNHYLDDYENSTYNYYSDYGFFNLAGRYAPQYSSYYRDEDYPAGYYWSSSANLTDQAYSFLISHEYSDVAHNLNRNDGLSVVCVLRGTPEY